ncbi:hypothetical protein [Parasphingorhabdus halotolerans]|uniref:Uncharacterized protein n=1 Tax=Parasphingorhabdus halotolerans TaxID=2725558 RepID=A0A6H2DQQ9_9SPHN|nr:hypothetical protein [Parasphingorhabdus halotolerans]QJB70006.1 hypothetical protein HF685_12500 [Parasphingorhabdus halotolerans]
MIALHTAVRRLLLCLIPLILSGCAIQLVPDYDQALVAGLDDANVAALTLFANLEEGSPTEEFTDYKNDYARLIGKFEALRQRANARAVPPLASKLAKKNIMPTFCRPENNPAECLNASPKSMAEIVSNLRVMRAFHKTRGLVPDAVADFRNRYDTQIDQALTVENALKR